MTQARVLKCLATIDSEIKKILTTENKKALGAMMIHAAKATAAEKRGDIKERILIEEKVKMEYSLIATSDIQHLLKASQRLSQLIDRLERVREFALFHNVSCLMEKKVTIGTDQINYLAPSSGLLFTESDKAFLKTQTKEFLDQMSQSFKKIPLFFDFYCLYREDERLQWERRTESAVTDFSSLFQYYVLTEVSYESFFYSLKKRGDKKSIPQTGDQLHCQLNLRFMETKTWSDSLIACFCNTDPLLLFSV